MREKRHRRWSIRLPGYDYTAPGAYFVTVCTVGRAPLFGAVRGGAISLTAFGDLAAQEWFHTAVRRPSVRLEPDEFVVMPDHVHGIIRLRNATRSRRAEGFGRPVPHSIPTVVRAYKSAVTRRINALRGSPGHVVWQRNYYERVIRDRAALQRIRQYITDNPKRWGHAGVGWGHDGIG